MGKNRFALGTRRRELVAAFLDKNPDSFGLERYDALEAEPDKIIDAITTLPFLAGERLVIIRDASLNKDLLTALEGALPRVSEATTVIFTDPALTKTSPLGKLLAKHGTLESIAPLQTTELRRWIQSYVSEQGGSITAGAIDRLTEHSIDQLLLANELDKLLLYDLAITDTTVDLLIEMTPKATIFEMLDQLMAGQTASAIRTIGRLRQNRIELHYIIAMLAWQFQLLTTVWTARGASPERVAADTGFSPFSIRKAQALARRTSRRQLREALGQLVTLDRTLKSRSVDEDGALETTLLKLSTVLTS